MNTAVHISPCRPRACVSRARCLIGEICLALCGMSSRLERNCDGSAGVFAGVRRSGYAEGESRAFACVAEGHCNSSRPVADPRPVRNNYQQLNWGVVRGASLPLCLYAPLTQSKCKSIIYGK